MDKVYADRCLDEFRRERVVCRQVAKPDLVAFYHPLRESEVVIDPRRESGAN
jgi:hypothetical protein